MFLKLAVSLSSQVDLSGTAVSSLIGQTLELHITRALFQMLAHN